MAVFGTSATGIRFPPPAAFALGLAAGFVLQHFQPQRLVAEAYSSELRLFGILLMIGGLVFAASAILAFRRAGTTVRPDRAASVLVTSGPFRLSRNPMYVSLSCVHAGIALVANALWPLLMLVPVLLVIRYFVIAREELFLTSAFGAQYQAYQREVRRWI